MAKFERRGRSNGNSSGGSFQRRDGSRRIDGRDRGPKRRSFSGRSSGNDRRGSRFSGRGSEMTKVVCSACSVKCEVPFTPTSDKPVFCSDCFSKTSDRNGTPSSSNNSSSVVLEEINSKLDRILDALDLD